MTDVLEPFEEEVKVRDAIWSGSGKAPRMTYQNHRDGSMTRILVRSDTTSERRGTTVWFSREEWDVLTRAVLAGLGLAPYQEEEK